MNGGDAGVATYAGVATSAGVATYAGVVTSVLEAATGRGRAVAGPLTPA